MLELNMSSIPKRLAVLPLSRFDATFVARRIRSDRLVKLPLCSAFFTASISSLSGFLPIGLEEPLCEDISGTAVALSMAPPFCKPPRICSTRGSTGGLRVESLGSVLLAPSSLGRPKDLLLDSSEGRSRKVVRGTLFTDSAC